MVDRREAAEELLRRQRVRGSLAELSKLCELAPAAHHLYIMKHLEQMTRGELNRLLISAPPGSAKSQTASVLFPVHFLANHPAAQIVTASHTESLAERFGRRVRNLITEHSSVLGLELSDDSQAAGRWSLKSGGSLFAIGAAGALAGYRADLVILDDVYRSMEDAYSENVRQRISDWFYGEVLPRLRPSGKVVAIGTRFHYADLFADLEASGRYKVIRLSAVAEEDDELGRPVGTLLWADQPDTYPYSESLAQQRAVLPPRIWSSLYMNNPSPEQGDYFKTEFFRPYTALPPREHMHIYGASDFAVSDGRGDRTVHGVVGVVSRADGTGVNLYLLDMWFRQASTDVGVDAFLDLVKQWRPLGWACEKGQLANAIEPFLRQRQRERNAHVAMEMFPTKGDKTIRCQSIRGRLAVDAMLVPEHAHWWPEVRTELLNFPADRFDDIPDVFGLIGQILDRMHAPSVPAPPKPKLKMLSTDPATNQVCMNDLWEAEERRYKRGARRI